MENIGEKRFREPRREKKKIPGEKISIEKAIDYLAEGEVAKEDKDFEKAIKYYQKAFNIYDKLAEQYKKEPKVVAGFKETRDKLNETKKLWAENLYNSGEKSITEGKHPEAIKHFQEAVKKNPKLIEAWVKLGNLSTISGNYENAHRNFKEGLAQNQESKERWKIWNGLGKLFLQIGEFPRAYSCLSEAKELEEKSFAIDYNLGLVFLNLQIGDPAVNTINAIKYLEEAKRKNPDFLPIKSALGIAWSNLGQMRASEETTLGNYKKGLKEFNETIEKNPSDISAWYKKGFLLPILQMGKPKEWLKETNRYFDEIFRILESRGEEKTEFTADVWYQKALIWRYWSDSNPYREKGHRNKDLKQCAKCLKTSLEIMKSLYEQKMLTEDGQKMSISAQTMLTEVETDLKRIEEWAKFSGTKKVKPIEDFNVMYV